MTTELEKQQNGELYTMHDPIFKQYKGWSYQFLMAYNQLLWSSSQTQAAFRAFTRQYRQKRCGGDTFFCSCVILPVTFIRIKSQSTWTVHSWTPVKSGWLVETMTCTKRPNLYRDPSVPLSQRLNEQWDEHWTAFRENPFLPVHNRKACLLDRWWRHYSSRCHYRWRMGRHPMTLAVWWQVIPDHVVASG